MDILKTVLPAIDRVFGMFQQVLQRTLLNRFSLVAVMLQLLTSGHKYISYDSCKTHLFFFITCALAQ